MNPVNTRTLVVICLLLFLSAFRLRAETTEKFIRLVEFQVWADWRGPEVARLLSDLYNKNGESHNFEIWDRPDLFVWDEDRMRGWVDEAVKLGCFNLFNIGDDTHTADGHLFDASGLNPKYREFYFNTVSYAHSRGLMVGVEPRAIPRPVTVENARRWARTFLDPSLGPERSTDVIKLSIEWLDAYDHNPNIAEETEAFITGVRDVNPDVFIYLDSIAGAWREVRKYHNWVMQKYPKMIISHYLYAEQVERFRAAGAKNIMVQVNPQEFRPEKGQFFVFHDRTVKILRDVVEREVPLLSIAGVNHGYNHYNYDLFLDIVRPHLNLLKNVSELQSLLEDNKPKESATKQEVFDEETRSKRARESRN